MFVPPPNGIRTASASRAARMIASTPPRARADDDVGQAAEVAGAVADEVAQALAARVDDAV